MGHDAHAKMRDLKEGDTVYIRGFDVKDKWLPGTITSPVSFRITLEDDRVVRRHIDHIRSRESTDLPVGATTSFDDVLPAPTEADSIEQPVGTAAVTVPLRRSTRISRPRVDLLKRLLTDLREEGCSIVRIGTI